MTRLILVRHGEVAGNMGGQAKLAFVGWGDLPLTDRGEKQSQAVAEHLSREKIAAAYSSDLQRAKTTAERIAQKHGLEVRADPDLREVNYGAWEGLGESDLLENWKEQWLARQGDAWNIAPPDGESYAQMWARFFPKWQRIVESHDNETVVLVGHNGLIRILLCHLLGAPFEYYKRIHVNNCGISRVETDGERVLIRCINDISHLKEN